MAAPITPNRQVELSSPNHIEKLSLGLWNRFMCKKGVDLEMRRGQRTVRAHRAVLDVFLSPDELVRQLQVQQIRVDLLDSLLEFVYRGRITIPSDQLGNMLALAKNIEFQILVEVLEDVMEPVVEPVQSEPQMPTDSKQQPWDWQSQAVKCEVLEESVGIDEVASGGDLDPMLHLQLMSQISPATMDGSTEPVTEPLVQPDDEDSIECSDDSSTSSFSQVTKRDQMDSVNSPASTSSSMPDNAGPVSDRTVGLHPYKCGKCQMTFSRTSQLDLHIQEHSLDDPDHLPPPVPFFSVNEPSRQATNGDSDQVEGCIGSVRVEVPSVLGDGGGKQFRCEECPKVFRIISSLQQHIRRRHRPNRFGFIAQPPVRLHCCALCPSSFKKSYNLRYHVTKCHPETVAPGTRHSCTLCDMSFSSVGHLNRHLMVKHNVTWHMGEARIVPL